MNSAENQPANATPAGETVADAAGTSARPDIDFAPTHAEALDTGSPGWWPEAVDGQCSEHAALFAASQPAPLNVV